MNNYKEGQIMYGCIRVFPHAKPSMRHMKLSEHNGTDFRGYENWSVELIDSHPWNDDGYKEYPIEVVWLRPIVGGNRNQ